MPRILSLLIFLSVGTLIISSIHYYLWVRIVKDAVFNVTYRNIGTYLFIFFAISFPFSIILSRLLSLKYSYPILWLSYLWLGVMMLFFFSFIFADLLKVIYCIFTKLLNFETFIIDIERRQFISRFIASGASAIVLVSTGIAIKNWYSKAVVKKIKIQLSELPDIFKGFKIVQISDIHMGQMMTGKGLKEIVDIVNNLKPDLIAITGDLVDGSTSQLSDDVSFIKNLKAEHGVYFVTGNHEYYSGVEKWTKQIEKFNIKVLQNESVMIQKENDYFYLVGVNDHEAKRFGKAHAPDFKKAFSGLDNARKKILLAHQPKDVRPASEYDTDLVLSGHTHGGQIWPFNYLVYLQQPYLKGSYQYKKTKLYVNQGTGTWGPPMRLGSFNEITEIVLT